MESWSRDFRYCVSCNTSKSPHAVAGFCIKCYNEIEVEEIHIEAKLRKCIKCDTMFLSKSKWVRKCTKCCRSDSKVSDRHRHKFLSGDSGCD